MIELNNIINSAGMFLFAKDKYFKFIYCNDNFAQAIGLDSPQQIVGKTDSDFFDKTYVEKYHLGDMKAINGEPFINVVESQKRLNQDFQNLVTKTPLKNIKNEINGVVGTFLTSQSSFRSLNEEMFHFNQESHKYEFYADQQKISFSKREYSVFKLILIGNTSKQIGIKLNLSYRTVEDYIDSIKNKLQCSSKSFIAETAIRLGIINQHFI